MLYTGLCESKNYIFLNDSYVNDEFLQSDACLYRIFVLVLHWDLAYLPTVRSVTHVRK